ncbi:MAG: antibiotic biosynthesis monooxygenase [Burkholderiales bacterium]|nr:antibiotic biosynthesis monooxygenase [Burkholderiales bacterium]
MDKPITIVARIRAAAGKGDALAALLTEQAGVVRASEPGCLAYRLHRSTKDPDLFVFYETYRDAAAEAAHHASPHIAAFRKRRQDGGLAAGPVDMEYLDALTE